MPSLREALEQIKREQGKVCPEYELCSHLACESSYASWAIADSALRGAALVATPAPAPLDDSHSFPACMVCGAYLSDPEALEPCVPVTARAAAAEDTE